MTGLELRVHGVSGTPPESLLDRPLVDRVGGDAVAGFYEPRLPEESTDAGPSRRAPILPNAPKLVGYCWGGLTSGSSGRALWLPLVPFTLINVAPRARPDTHGSDSTRVRVIWFFSRALALSLTVLFTLAAIGIGPDLLAWQCAKRPDGTLPCSNEVLPDWIVEQRFELERMLLLATLVPIAVVTLLWLVTRRAGGRYEKVKTGLTTRASDLDAAEVGLDSPYMWRNSEPIKRLRGLHVQCAFAVVLATVLVPTDWVWLAAVPAVIVCFAVVALGCPSFNSHEKSRTWSKVSAAVWSVLGICAAATLVGLQTRNAEVREKFVQLGDGSRVGTKGLPYFDVLVLGVSATAFGLLILLTVVVGFAAWRATPMPAPNGHGPLRPGLWGMTCAALAALGVFLGAVFSAGTYLYTAAVLTSGSLRPSFRDVSSLYQSLTVPPTIATAAVAYAQAVFALVGIVLICVVAVGIATRGDSHYDRQIDADYTAAKDPSRRKQIRRAMVTGSLVDRAPVLIGSLVAAGLVIVPLAVIQTELLSRKRAREAVEDDVLGLGTDTWSALGAYAAIATLLGLVSLGALAFRVEKTRRSVGVLWDLGAFWPRQCHPLAPPCYAERAVPDLVGYLAYQREHRPDQPVVLAAHSQGTVIGAAVLFQLAKRNESVKPAPLHGLGLLTFGCVLRRLYGRYFPVYFAPSQLAKLQELLTPAGVAGPDPPAPPRWINLWRYTDYLGGQVTAGPPAEIPSGEIPTVVPDVLPGACARAGPTAWEWHAPDPPRFARDDEYGSYSAAQKHSNYWADESGYFQLAVGKLVELASTGTDNVG